MKFFDTKYILGLLFGLVLFYYISAAPTVPSEDLLKEGFNDSFRLADCTCPFQCSDVCPNQSVYGRDPSPIPVASKTCLRSNCCPRALTGVNRAAFTDRDCIPDTASIEVQSPCGPVATFNANESPLEHAYMRDKNVFLSQPQVINNIKDNAIPPHMVTQVALERRPFTRDPVPENAFIKESPCDFKSEKTNLQSFFRRNTNLFFRDQQQFPIDQLAWNDKTDCFNNIMYNTDLSPKEHFIVNKI